LEQLEQLPVTARFKHRQMSRAAAEGLRARRGAPVAADTVRGAQAAIVQVADRGVEPGPVTP
jgi:hypothetical protein